MRRLLALYVPAATLLGYIFLFAPLAVLVIYAFNAGRSTVIWEGFSLAWFAEALRDRGLRAGLQVSVIVAVASAALATIIGTSAALAVVKRPFAGKNLFSTLIIAPLEAFSSRKVNRSTASYALSPTIGTATWNCVAPPGVNVSVPCVAV